MIRERIKSTLQKLLERFKTGRDRAYKRRDAVYDDSDAEAYAAGEAHAYGEAADQVRQAQVKGAVDEWADHRVNVWNLSIAIIAPPSDDAAWNRLDAIVAGLGEDMQPRVGTVWSLDYPTAEATLEQAIADVELRLLSVDRDALDLLQVGEATTT